MAERTETRARNRMGRSCNWVIAAAIVATVGLTAGADGRNLAKLRVLSDGYPRVFFFRQAEGMAARKSGAYEQWEQTFDRLMGITGKALDEEIPGRSIKNIDFFTRFKQRHGDKLVLLHFNGNARDPRYESDRFFAGHWVYFNGAKILADVAAEEGETDIRVDKPNLFKVNMGRYRSRNEDIGLCAIDADGKPDAGLHDGFNAYGAGVVEFCRQLRETLGENTLILADGMHEGNQRAFGLLNGIESEGWPHLRDHEITDWSGGLNRHFFWNSNARPPVANYINHKFNMPTGRPGVVKPPAVPFSTHRLVFAVGVFTDSAMCYSFAPPNERGAPIGIWDEFRMGTENKLGWLGKPLGPPVRMAKRRPDLLKGQVNPTGESVRFERGSDGLKVTAANAKAREIRFRLTDVPCDGRDLFVSLTARGNPMKGYPKEVARMMYVSVDSEADGTHERFMTWVNDEDFYSGFYFSKIESDSVDLEFVIEGSEPLSISNVRAHAHPDAIYRLFEHGVALANPSPRQYVFDLDRLLPGQTFRRLRGSRMQDRVANDGSAVGDKLELGPKEGLFLVRVE